MENESKQFERKYFPVSDEAAKRAKQMYSFSDYVIGSVAADYKLTADIAYDMAEERIKGGLTADNAETVWRLATRYASKMAAYINAVNANDASCPSVLISGPANFPVRKKEKQQARAKKLMAEYEYIKGLLAKIQNIASSNAIKSNDPNAVELLEAKVEILESAHEGMIAANKYWRKHGTMKGCADWTDEQATEMDAYLAKSVWPPYRPYALANSKKNIADVKARIAGIKKNKAVAAAGGYEYETNGLCKVVEDETAMRIRLLFPDKPDEQRRAILKRNGFVWSPSAGAWQRQLNNNGRYAVRRVLEILREAETNG